MGYFCLESPVLHIRLAYSEGHSQLEFAARPAMPVYPDAFSPVHTEAGRGKPALTIRTKSLHPTSLPSMCFVWVVRIYNLEDSSIQEP